MEFILNQAFENLSAPTIDMIEFARRHELAHSFHPKPETNGCIEVAFYRINPRDGLMGGSTSLEVRSMLFSAALNGEEIIAQIDSRADKGISTNRVRRCIVDQGFDFRFKNKLDAEKTLGLRMGEINAISVRHAAAEKNIPVLLIVSDELTRHSKPFSHNAGVRTRGVVFDDSKSFYKALAMEAQQGAGITAILTVPSKIVCTTALSR